MASKWYRLVCRLGTRLDQPFCRQLRKARCRGCNRREWSVVVTAGYSKRQREVVWDAVGLVDQLRMIDVVQPRLLHAQRNHGTAAVDPLIRIRGLHLYIPEHKPWRCGNILPVGNLINSVKKFLQLWRQQQFFDLFLIADSNVVHLKVAVG